VATLFFFAGLLGGFFSLRRKTIRSRLLRLLAAYAAWALLGALVAAGLGLQSSNGYTAPGIDVTLGFAPFLFSGLFLSYAVAVADVVTERHSAAPAFRLSSTSVV
jgi:hypothetical protein